MNSHRSRALLGAASALLVYAIMAGTALLWKKPCYWADWAVISLIYGVVFWLLAGGPWPILREVPDAPAHAHSLRLRYAGGVDFAVVCDICHEKFALHEDVRNTMSAVIIGLVFLFGLVFIILPVTLPKPYDALHILLYWLPAVYVGQLICWLYMRRRDPVSFLSAEARAKLRADAAED